MKKHFLYILLVLFCQMHILFPSQTPEHIDYFKTAVLAYVHEGKGICLAFPGKDLGITICDAKQLTYLTPTDSCATCYYETKERKLVGLVISKEVMNQLRQSEPFWQVNGNSNLFLKNVNQDSPIDLWRKTINKDLNRNSLEEIISISQCFQPTTLIFNPYKYYLEIERESKKQRIIRNIKLFLLIVGTIYFSYIIDHSSFASTLSGNQRFGLGGVFGVIFSWILIREGYWDKTSFYPRY